MSLLTFAFAARLSLDPLTASGLATLLATPSAQPRLVVFWASWCGACRAEIALLAPYAQAHPGVSVVTVSVDTPADASAAVAVLTRAKLEGGYLLGPDAPNAVAQVVPRWPSLIPVTLALAPSGLEVGRVEGAATRAALDGLLPP